MNMASSNAIIKLGLMAPLTGLVKMYGSEIVRAAQIACMEINESGGLLGKQLELVVEDDGSLTESAVIAAENLVLDHKCVAIIGNLLSNSRIAVALRVAEPRKIPLLNFSFYEGSILSKYFFHFAALPNQQIDKAIPYMLNKFGSKFFFAGNNYEWPRGSIAAAKEILEKSNGFVVGEEYSSIGVSPLEIERLLDNLEKSNADVFVPYFAGDDQVHLLTQFTQRGLKRKMAVVMGHYDETMVSYLSPEVRAGFFSSNTYFMTLKTPENIDFLRRLKTMPGITGIWPNGNGTLTNFGEGVYVCIKAFAAAVRNANSIDPEALIPELEKVVIQAPQGEVKMDAKTHHARVNTYIAQCQLDGTFEIIESFGAIDPILPERYKYFAMASGPIEDDIRLQSRIVEQMSEAVLLVDSQNGSIIYANSAADRMFGFEKSELPGKNISILHAADINTLKEVTPDIEKILYKKGVWSGEVKNQKKNKEEIWCSVSISTFTHAKHGEVWMMVYKDISDRKAYDEQLNIAKEEAERANNSKSMFLASMSHEIRTPMNTIIGMTDLIMETQLTEEQKKYVQTLQGASEVLLALVNDVLDISKIEQESFGLISEPFDFCEMVDSCIELLSPKARQKGLDVFCDVDENMPCQLIGDSARLKQIIVNLLSNAIKFTNKGHVILKVRTGRIKNEFMPLTLDIFDTGIGIPPEMQKEIFKPFVQADAGVMKKYGGTGLGLSISRSLAEKMEGKIYLRSKVDKYSIFRVKLNLQVASTTMLRDILLQEYKELHGKKALVVDYSKAMTRFFTKALNQVKIQTSVVSEDNLLSVISETHKKNEAIDFFIFSYGVNPEHGCQLCEKISASYLTRQQRPQLLAIGPLFNRPESCGMGLETLECKWLFSPVKKRDLLTSLKQSLPLNQKEGHKDMEGKPETPELHGKVLVVDDSDDNQLLIQVLLKKIGLDLDFASNGREALEKYQNQKYDLILMDMQMPIMDGYTAMKEIRKIEDQKHEEHVPILALTAFAMKEDKSKCLEAGATDYLAKPIRKVTLIDMIDKYMTTGV